MARRCFYCTRPMGREEWGLLGANGRFHRNCARKLCNTGEAPVLVVQHPGPSRQWGVSSHQVPVAAVARVSMGR